MAANDRPAKDDYCDKSVRPVVELVELNKICATLNDYDNVGRRHKLDKHHMVIRVYDASGNLVEMMYNFRRVPWARCYTYLYDAILPNDVDLGQWPSRVEIEACSCRY